MALAYLTSWNRAGAWEQYFALRDISPELAANLAKTLERSPKFSPWVHMTKFCWGRRRQMLSWLFILGLTALLLACGSSPGDAPAPAGPAWLARIGNQTVDAQEFQAYLEQQTRRNPRLQITPAMKRELLEKYLEKKLLLAEASRQRLGDQPEIIKELEEMKEQVLIKHLFSLKEKELAGQIKIE